MRESLIVVLVFLVHLVYLVSLVQRIQRDKRNKPSVLNATSRTVCASARRNGWSSHGLSSINKIAEWEGIDRQNVSAGNVSGSMMKIVTVQLFVLTISYEFNIM